MGPELPHVDIHLQPNDYHIFQQPPERLFEEQQNTKRGVGGVGFGFFDRPNAQFYGYWFSAEDNHWHKKKKEKPMGNFLKIPLNRSWTARDWQYDHMGLLVFNPCSHTVGRCSGVEGLHSPPPPPRSRCRTPGWSPSWWRSWRCSTSCRWGRPPQWGAGGGHQTRWQARWSHLEGCWCTPHNLKMLLWGTSVFVTIADLVTLDDRSN